jgi:hypothetical protein
MVNIGPILILVVVAIIVVTINWKKYEKREINKKSFVLNVAILLIMISFSGYILGIP